MMGLGGELSEVEIFHLTMTHFGKTNKNGGVLLFFFFKSQVCIDGEKDG
jgi:hypothetical protein